MTTAITSGLDTAHPRAAQSAAAGFWIRVGATLLDMLVLSPVLAPIWYNRTHWKSLGLELMMTVGVLLYCIGMEATFGGTVGKMMAGVRVVDSSGERISWWQAALRHSPTLASTALSIPAILFLYGNPEFYTTTDLFRTQEIADSAQQFPSLSLILSLVMLIDVLVVPLSLRKRALHDLLAGTYCIRS